MKQESAETRLLKTLGELVTVVTHDTAIGVAQAAPELSGWTSTLARLSVAEMRARIMDGRLDLMTATSEEIEVTITICVATAAGRLYTPRLITAPRGGDDPQAPNREPLGEN